MSQPNNDPRVLAAKARASLLQTLLLLAVVGVYIYLIIATDFRVPTWAFFLLAFGFIMTRRWVDSFIERRYAERARQAMPGSWPTDGGYLAPSSTVTVPGVATTSGGATSTPGTDPQSGYAPQREHAATHGGAATGLDFPVERVTTMPDGAAGVAGVVNLGQAVVGMPIRLVRPGDRDLEGTIVGIGMNGRWVQQAGVDQGVWLAVRGIAPHDIRVGDRIVA